MARATTAVKSRAAPDTDAISFPVLTYTDALPRDDLRDIKDNRSGQLPEHGKVAQYEVPRPRHTHRQGSRNQPPGVAMAASFDFRVTAPPDEVFPSGTGANGSPGGIPRIGVALGSPSMLDSRDNLPPPRFKTDMFSQEQGGQPPLPRKPSKWKKIGGLFKAKHALAMPIDVPIVPPKQSTPKPESEQRSKPPQRRGSIEEWPIIEVDTTAAPAGTNSSPQRSHKLSLPGKKANKPQVPEKVEKSRLLEIDIPDVQMERYSVMFSQVMKKNQRPSLLARRSKTLENLRVPNNQDFLAAKLPPVPQRRATSPARSSFTLFPASQPSKAAQVLGTQQNFARGPSPLLRSNTLPIESPSKASMDQGRETPNINVAAPFESPVVPNIFASHSSTPRSSLDKPLPAIKPELQAPQSRPRTASKLAVAQTAKELSQVKNAKVEERPQTAKQLAVTPNLQVSEPPRNSPSSWEEPTPSVPPVNTRRRSASLALPRSRTDSQVEQKPIQPIPALRPRPAQLPISQIQPTYQERKSSLQAPRVHTRLPIQPPPKPHLNPQKTPKPVQEMEQRPQHRPDVRPPRPNLKIQTRQQPPPRPPAKKGSSSSTLPTSTPPTSTLPTPNLSKDSLYRTPSPIIRSLSPQPGISPGGSSPRMPFVSEPEEIEIEIEIGMALETKESPESLHKIPTIEVSIARSISVSRGKRQMIVPIGARVDHLHSNERLIERRPMTPRITDVSYGHKYAVSQELQIESL